MCPFSIWQIVTMAALHHESCGTCFHLAELANLRTIDLIIGKSCGSLFMSIFSEKSLNYLWQDCKHNKSSSVLITDFCCGSWKWCEYSWVLNPIKTEWILNRISNQFNSENYYIPVDWVQVFFLFLLYLWYHLIGDDQIPQIGFSWNRVFSCMNKQNYFLKWLLKNNPTNWTILFLFLNMKEWTSPSLLILTMKHYTVNANIWTLLEKCFKV